MKGFRSSERVQTALLVGPAVLLLGAVAVYPVVAALWLSLHRSILVFHEQSFIGLSNYLFLASDARFLTALGNTTYFTAVAVALEVALALPIALALNAKLPARGLFRVSVLLPWAIPTVVAARMWAWLYNPDYGLLDSVWGNSEVSWLGTPGIAIHAAILVDVWKTTPFVALFILAGLQSIPEDVYKAARIDGASELRIFFSITLPLLKPSLALALIFRTLDAFRVFDAIWVLTEGGPANTTETLSVYAYKTLMRTGDFGYGATLSVVTFACVLVLSVLYIRLIGRDAGARR